MKRSLPVALVLLLLPGLAFADAGAAPAFDPSLLELAFRGIAEGNWFLVAGPALTLVTLGVRWLLANRWQALATSDRWGVAITAALAGAGALAHAWLAGESALEATTWLGALKVFAMAVATYVVTRRLVGAGGHLKLYVQEGETAADIAARIAAEMDLPKDTKPPQAGFVQLPLMLTLTLAGLLLANVSCGATAREKALRTTFIATSSAQAGFITWDKEHQLQIARAAPSQGEGLAELARYHDKRSAVLVAFEATYRTLAAAAIVNEDPKSLAAAIGAFEQLRLALSTVTGGKLP